MSIEGSSTVASHKTTASDTTRMGKGKGAVNGASDSLAGTGAGFLALLNSFDPETVADAVSALPLTKDESPLASPAPTDPSIFLFSPQDTSTDLQLLLAQASEVPVERSNLPQAVPATQPTLPAASSALGGPEHVSLSAWPVLPQAVPATQPTLPAASSALGVPEHVSLSPEPVLPQAVPATQPTLPAASSALGGPEHVSLSAWPVADVDLIVSPDQSLGAAVSATGFVNRVDLPVGVPSGVKSVPDASVASRVDELVGTVLPVNTMTASNMRGSAEVTLGVAVPPDLMLPQPLSLSRAAKSKLLEGLAGTSDAATGWRMSDLSAPGDVVSREASLLEALSPQNQGGGGGRAADQSGGKSLFSWAGSGVEGVWGQSSFQSGPFVEPATGVAGSSASAMESMLADTVSYWVARGAEHAELKLDGFGALPLEVSISMQGGEAHIDFRTDHPEIRQMLEGASPQLKDLLKGEGVVLSGVSIGASGQNASGRHEERNRSGARHGNAGGTKIASLDNLRPVSPPSGRVLDLFV